MCVGYTSCSDVISSDVISFEENRTDYSDIRELYPSVGSNAFVALDTVIYLNPDWSSPKVKSISSGTCVSVLGYIDDWAVVPSGYVYGGYLCNSYDKDISISTNSDDCKRYIGYLHGKLASLEGKLLKVAESVPFYLVESSSDLNTSSRSPSGVTIKYSGVDLFDISLVCNSNLFCSATHEIGHVIDYKDPVKGKTYSGTKKWVSIYEKEVKQYRKVYKPSEHNTSDAREYFADCIKRYVKDKSKLKESVPLSYEFIENILGGE